MNQQCYRPTANSTNLPSDSSSNFMSISPPRNLGSTSSSSSQNPSQNPNSDHGPVFPQPYPRRNQPPDSPSHQIRTQSPPSVQISNSRPPNAMSNKVSGPVALASEDSGGSSKKVNEAGKQNGKRSSGYKKDVNISQRDACNRAGNGSAQHKGKLSEIIVSQRIQQSYGSNSSQGTAAHSAGRKSQMVNGNHLLNFYYDPISWTQPRAPPPRRQQRKQPYNKDLFLQANYKFVLLDSGNNSLESLDPDKTLRWEDIVCVKYSTPVPIQCPVCLEDLLCPQITSCGHIFCFPCILRYFFMGEDDHKGECWKKCPLCFMMISSKDLYTIYVENVMQHCVGDTVEFMLLTRQKDSFILSLKNQRMGMNEEVRDSFSKFTFTSDVDLSVRKAMSELDGWLARADSGLVDDLERLPYVCAAMEQLEERKKYWNCHQGSKGPDACKLSDCHTTSSLISSATNANRGAYEFTLGAHSASANDKSLWLGNSISQKIDGDPSVDQTADVVEAYDHQDGALSSSYDDSKSAQRHINGVRDRTEKDSYSFYQAVDGQHLILHPLNMKCLLHHYGSYEKLPHRICGKILQLETVTQSEAMRRRYRYLSHFSLTTTFQLCEIDLNESLPPSALSPFIDQIKKREKQRKQLARKEREEKIKSEAAAQYMVLPADFGQSSKEYISTFSTDEFEALGSSVMTSSSPPTVGERPLFSNVARLGFAAAHDSPALKREEAHTLPKAEVRSDIPGVTGLRNAGSSSSSSSFANIISRANPPVEPNNKMSELGKKGKKPSRVLLSTAGVRRY